MTSPPDSAAAKRTVERIRRAAPGALVGGGAASELDLADAQAHDRRIVIPLVLGVVLAVLIALLRALVAPLLVMATVVASYFAALDGSWLRFRHAFGFPAMDVQVALMDFLFMVALGVDYNLFLVSRVLASTFGVLGVMPVTMFGEIGVLVSLGVLLDTFVVRPVLVPALALDTGPRFWWPDRLPRAQARPAPDREPVPSP
ncbi:MMPL family transporter [Spirillospora sp. NPDC046719]